MKKYGLYLEFIFICCIFILPPLFAAPVENTDYDFSFSWFSAVSFLAALYVFFRYEYSAKKHKKFSFFNFLLSAGRVFLYFGLLILVHILITAAGIFLNVQNYGRTIELNFLKTFLITVNFIARAFFEENIYRLYLPCVLHGFIEKFYEAFFHKQAESFKARFFMAADGFMEIFCIAVFALSHRYLGVLSVINAFVCGALLRYCVKKSSTVLTASCSHALYNITVFFSNFLL
ncbi:MAG: type II CAAX prenyl endopeptidase Rce1 family protein [Treponema sp.]